MSFANPLNTLFSPFVFLLLWTIKADKMLPGNQTIPALTAFGDSILDTGNNNNLKALIKCNFSPYGRDFIGRKPTGRFSDGKVPSDLIDSTNKKRGRTRPSLYQPSFILNFVRKGIGLSTGHPFFSLHVACEYVIFVSAEALGIKELSPAYLDQRTKVEGLLIGACFASGGAGFDPLTATTAAVLSLSEQLELFKEYLTKLRGIAGEDRANTIISNSLYIVSAGNNDIAGSYYLTQLRKLQYDVPSYVALLVSYASRFLKDIYELRARRIAIFSTLPLGCLPLERTLKGGIRRLCAENINQAAELFNAKLSSELQSLNSNLPDANIVHIDLYCPVLDLIQDPAKFGFEVANLACCRTGTIEVAVLCNKLDPFTSSDTSKYVFWDSAHLTEMAYKILISQIFQKDAHGLFCGRSPC